MNRLKLFLLCTSLVVMLSSYQQIPAVCDDVQRTEQDENFPYPDIPAMITTPAERAAYLLTHYWDKVDFNRHKLTKKDALMEQGFVNFLSVFPHADSLVLHTAVGNMLKQAIIKESRTQPLFDLVEDYLYHPNSPMLNEDYYRIFLEEFLKIDNLLLTIREKCKFQLKAVNRNKVGDKVANFTFLGEDDQTAELYKITAPITFLLFYDADCAACKYLLSQMEGSKELEELIQSQQLKVVTVCIEGTEKQRKKMSDKFPEEWVKGRMEDAYPLFRDYVFRAMPTAYLLDKDKKVVLKEMNWSRFLSYFAIQ